MFFVDDDRVRYLEILADQSERFGLTIDGYCLMTNHIHLKFGDRYQNRAKRRDQSDCGFRISDLPAGRQVAEFGTETAGELPCVDMSNTDRSGPRCTDAPDTDFLTH